MEVALIITTYNRPDALESVLVSVNSLIVKPSQVIIADDGSGTETKMLIDKYRTLSEIPLLHAWHPDNGFRAAEIRNRALSLVKCPYVIIIDGDMILNPYFVKDHIRFAQKGFFIQGGRFLLTEKKTLHILQNPSRPFKPVYGDPDIEYRFEKRLFAFRNTILAQMIKRPITYSHRAIRSCNMSFFYEDAVRVNGFNNEFVGWGREDSEFVERMFNAGVRRVNIKFSAIAYHLYHKEEPRSALPQNDKILNDAILHKSKWCENGLNRFTNQSQG
ncbi:glycosyltransferase family 2 protein [Sphingobacterium sp. SYP-B4668]|uniref:glycosyltransferase family 2 protein n=1 Tax=Sphingobacterium sp. SYP-B4668 TaxID=2996035 RepID=UPI0022DD97EA|nr:glycosyltransferase family 2 protein [Sphingobacterium sp. SYP-B4668]